MNITEVFTRRPVMTTLDMSGFVSFGAAGYRSLPVSDLPNVDFPTLRVNANLPGAGPETMAASVAAPLERQFSVGGLVVSQGLTLYITPVFYLYAEKLRTLRRRAAPLREFADTAIS